MFCADKSFRLWSCAKTFVILSLSCIRNGVASHFVLLHNMAFYMMEGDLLWHTLLVMVASAAVHALLSALFQLFLRETLSTLSMQIHVSTAVHVQLSALFQQFHRVESKQKIMKEQFSSSLEELLFFYFIFGEAK